MKKILFLILIISLVSCSKHTADLRTNGAVPTAAIEFKLDNVLKQFTDIQALRTLSTVPSVTPKYVYTFYAAKEPASENYFSFTLLTDSLKVGTYEVRENGTGVVIFREGSLIAVNSTDSSGITFTVTSNVNGLVSGSFFGNLHNATINKASTIVEGKMTNVQLLYSH